MTKPKMTPHELVDYWMEAAASITEDLNTHRSELLSTEAGKVEARMMVTTRTALVMCAKALKESLCVACDRKGNQ